MTDFQKVAFDESADAKSREAAIYSLGAHLAKEKRADDLISLIRGIQPFALTIPKARTSKIIRTLLENLDEISGTVSKQAELCAELIEWAKREKRTFLRQRIDFRLATCLLKLNEFVKALGIIEALNRELKRLDDKALLLEVQLLESVGHFALRDLPKAKAALTAARTSSNAIYCPPKLQAEIDTQSGVILAAEGDFNTAFSYFFESFETKHQMGHEEGASQALKYMLLCKVMSGKAGDVPAVANGKNAIHHAGRDVEAIRAVALSYGNRSIHEFEAALQTYKPELQDDQFVFGHLSKLYDSLLVANLSRVVEPFSRVQIDHVASLINLPTAVVEQKLSQMILNKKLDGILDQGARDLIIFEASSADKTFEAATETIQALGTVVDALFERVACLT